MKNRITNISIIVLLIVCLLLGGRVLYMSYIRDCERYNDNIVTFTIEVIKGNKTLQDIEFLDVDDSVKESLINYYNENFYSGEDFIVLYDDIEFVNENKDRIAEMQADYGDSLLDENSSYFLGSISEDDLASFTKEEIKYFELSQIYIDILKNEVDSRVFEKDNQICIYLKDLNFNSEGFERIIYKGLRFNVFIDSLDKNLTSYRQDTDLFKELYIKSSIETDSGFKVILNNSIGSTVTLNFDESFNKIIDVSISERY